MFGVLTQLLIDLADDFVQNVTVAASKLNKVRGGEMLESQDASHVLGTVANKERIYDIRVPGFGEDMPEGKKKKGPKVPALHEARVQAVHNAIKRTSSSRRAGRRPRAK